MARLSIFILLVSFCINAVSAQAESPKKDLDWVKIKDKNGIQVYRAHTEHSKFKSFRAVTRIELENIQAFTGLLMDGENYQKWLHMISSAEIQPTEKPEENEMVIITRMPWPVKDRLVKVKTSLSQSEDYSLRWNISDPDVPAPPQKGFIIVPETHGYYELQTVPDSKDVIITVEVFADPGGYIPPFLINIITGDFSYFTTNKMRKFIKLEKYQDYEHPLVKRRPWVVNTEAE